MDLGFNGLVEKFEGRFGKHVTTFVRAMVGVGVVSAGVGLAVQNVIVPAIHLYKNFNSPTFKLWVQNNFLPALLSFVIFIPLWQAFVAVVWKLYDRTIGERQRKKKQQALTEKLTAELEAKAAPIIADVKKRQEEMDAELAGVKKTVFDHFDSQRAELKEYEEYLDQRFELASSLAAKIRDAIKPEKPEETKMLLEQLLADMKKPRPQVAEPEAKKTDAESDGD
jgi:hypothetical protein